MRITATITVNAGSPVNVAKALGLDAAFPVWASRWVAQALHGGTGRILVYDGVQPRGTTPGGSNTANELAPATATAPGGSYSDAFEADADNQGDIDLSLSWIDGSHTGDTVAVSANLRI